jgi:hypothetical protein
MSKFSKLDGYPKQGNLSGDLFENSIQVDARARRGSAG